MIRKILRKILLSMFVLFTLTVSSVYAQEDNTEMQSPICGNSTGIMTANPALTDSRFEVEKFVSGLDWPTTMAFIGNDILVLQKNNGLVCLVRGGELQEKPILDLEVAIDGTGLLGITTRGQSDVYLYLSEAENDGEKSIGNHIYKYFWNGEELINPTLMKNIVYTDLDDPHMGGAMVSHFDGNVYAIIGDAHQEEKNQNFMSGLEDDSGTIISVESNEKHYAVGIRNSFGIAVDPLTGNIWDTENGPDYNDEINLVLPYFNSGWKKIMGPGSEEDIKDINYEGYQYSDPEFTWEVPIGVTAITFVESELFRDFNNSILVGDFINGNIYKFNLNEERTGFVFNDPAFSDLVVNRGESMHEITFGTGFAGITDIEVGSDGIIYIVSILEGSIYRIIHSEKSLDDSILSTCFSEANLDKKVVGCDLSGVSLQNQNFNFKDLSQVNFSDANLVGSSFSHSNMTGADFRGANLTNSFLSSTILSGSLLQDSDLSGAEIKNSMFDGTNLENAKMNSVNLKNANFNNANLVNVDLSEANLNYVLVKNSNFKGADLSSTNLDYAYIYNSNFQDTSIRDSIIYRANFTGTDFSGSNLEGIYPYSTDFTDVVFSKESKTDSCLDIDPYSRLMNRLLREIRQIDSEILEPFELLIVQMCKP